MMRRPLAGFLVFAFVLSLVPAASASRLYNSANIGDTGTLSRLLAIDPDSGEVVEFQSESYQGEYFGFGVDPRENRIYWSDSRFSHDEAEYSATIRRTTGQSCEIIKGPVHASRAFRFLALDLDSEKIYWTERTDQTGGRIRRANLDGSGFESLVTLLPDPLRIRLDLVHGKVYWTDSGGEGPQEPNGSLFRANLDGSNVELVYFGLHPRGLAVDALAGKLYWSVWSAEGGALTRADLDGSNVEQVFTTPLAMGAIDIDTLGGKIYWMEVYDVLEATRLWRADLDGSNLEMVSTDDAGGPLGNGELLFDAGDADLGPFESCGAILIPTPMLDARGKILLVAAFLLAGAILVDLHGVTSC
jgi:hypothetical protein